MTEPTRSRPRFTLAKFIVALLILGAAFIWASRGSPRCWRNYLGQTKAEVTAALGQPRYNERIHNLGYVRGETYFVWWPYGIGGRLCMYFDGNGRAVRQYIGEPK